MPDQEMMAAVDMLEAALIVIVEDAHELAVASVPESAKSRRGTCGGAPADRD